MFIMRIRSGIPAVDTITWYWKSPLSSPGEPFQIIFLLCIVKCMQIGIYDLRRKSIIRTFNTLYSSIPTSLHSCHGAEQGAYCLLSVLTDLEYSTIRHTDSIEVHTLNIVKIHKIGLVYPDKISITF